VLNPRVKGDTGLKAETYVPVDTRAAAAARRNILLRFKELVKGVREPCNQDEEVEPTTPLGWEMWRKAMIRGHFLCTHPQKTRLR
jgi:hypothetical protein